MPLSKSKLAEALTELYDSSTYGVNSASYQGGSNGGVLLGNSFKNKWKATAEVIAEYLKQCFPAVTTPIYDEAAVKLIEAKYPSVTLLTFSSNLASYMADLGKVAGTAMLPLYKGIAPNDPDLKRKLASAYTENLQPGKTNADCAKVIAEVVHEYYKKGSAQPASGFAAYPPIPSWAIAEMPGAKRDGYYSTDKWTPVDNVRTPESNRLRAALRALGYGEKLKSNSTYGGEISSNYGTSLYRITDISPELANFCSWLFGLLSQEIPELTICCSGGNDKFHNPQIPNAPQKDITYDSHHSAGMAMDFVIATGSSRGGNSTILKVEDILRSIEGSDSNLRDDSTEEYPRPYFRFINEYYHLSKSGTGNHFHIIVVPDRNHGNEKNFRYSGEGLTNGTRWKLSRKAVQNGSYTTTNEATGQTYTRRIDIGGISLPRSIRRDM